MGRFDIFPIFIATFASRRVTLIATHSKSQKQTRLPIRYLYFILPFKLLINKEVIKVFQNYRKILVQARLHNRNLSQPCSHCPFSSLMARGGRTSIPKGAKPMKTCSALHRASQHAAMTDAMRCDGQRRALAEIWRKQ